MARENHGSARILISEDRVAGGDPEAETHRRRRTGERRLPAATPLRGPTGEETPASKPSSPWFLAKKRSGKARKREGILRSRIWMGEEKGDDEEPRG